MRTQIVCLSAAISLSSCGASSGFVPVETPLDNLGGILGSPGGSCNKVDFSQVQWPSGLTSDLQAALALGMEVSGSYEGNSAWSTISNSFDGMGLSLGLLNQNLGSGSLQPIFLSLRDQHLPVLQKAFISAHLQSLLGMVSAWQSATGAKAFSLEDRLPSHIDRVDDSLVFDLSASGAAQQSVQWALSNLYTDPQGRNFIPEWKTELQTVAATKEHISLQVGAAYTYSQMAISYMRKLGFFQLGSYLFFFDIVVQDGGFSSSELTTLQNQLKAQPGWTEIQKAQAVLNYLLNRVKSPYVGDVQSRKQTILDGHGTVHGAARNLEQEYCFDRQSQLLH